MSPERWQQIEAVFQQAADLTQPERQNFLAEACAGDAELYLEVEKLVASFESADSFIESPVWTDSSVLNSTAKKAISDSINEQFKTDGGEDFIGQTIGVYKLVKELGRGGMGTVYLAERADGEFSQNVAIKIIKRGMDSDFIIRRFRHERQILASFEHPFIARLLDGGTAADGIPYFVMEYIEGQTLYNYCDQKRLGVSDRLKLFQKVCSAIAYAHHRQIIHRDIKPSNILIDRFGSPKLLDFGIAKVLDPNLIHDSVNPTASIMRMMTPDYASPEQIQGSEITPASDIYSLGVLLYELLTGHRPYNFSGRALHEVSRVVCEVTPELPSRVIGFDSYLLPQYNQGKGLFAVARGMTPSELKRTLTDDVDNIIMKALNKAPAERYGSVSELSEDISLHLRGQAIGAAAFEPRSDNADAPYKHLSAESNSKALAILPFRFVNLSSDGDTDDRFLGLGLADALITRLSKIRRFVVRPTSSILSFGDEPADPIKAGRDLNVDFILDGNIKRGTNRLRVTVQLLNVADNAAVWAASIDEDIADVFTLEDTLSNKLVEVLLPQLTGREREEYSKRGTEEPEAFEHYLRGRYHFNTFTEEGFAKAFVSFHSAVAVDPNYAHAYSGIADYYNWLGIMGVLPPQECFQPAVRAASKAVELDDGLSEAHASLGFSLHAGNYDWAGAEYHLTRAIELNPSNANAYVWYSIVLYTEGRFTEGLEFARRSIDLDPLAPFNHHNLGWGLYFARRYDDAAAQYRRVIADFPEYSFGYYGLSKVQRISGETAAAIDLAKKAKELMGGSVFSLIAEAECYAADGQMETVAELVEELKSLSKSRFVSPYQFSLVYSFLKDRENSIAKLGEAVEIKEAWLNWLAVEPAFDFIRDDPRFAEISEPIAYGGFAKKYSSRDKRLTVPQIALHASDSNQPKPGDQLHNLTTLVIDKSHRTEDGAARERSERWMNSRLLPYASVALLLMLVSFGAFAWYRSRAGANPAALGGLTFRNPSIVILPFKSEEPATDTIGVGLADALANKLGNIKSLQVISASSGRAMAGAEPEAIGRDLNVSFVLRGVIHRSDPGLRLDAELVQTSDGSVVWKKEFPVDNGDLFGLQTQLAESVWTTLGIAPLPMERQQIYNGSTSSNEAYQLYLIGRYQMTDRSPEGLRKAIETFGKSTDADPDFALAYVGTADAYALLMLYDIDPPADSYQKAQRNASKALAIDDNLAEAHATLGYIKFYHERDRNGSELEFRRAIQSNPSYAQAHHWFALVLTAMGRSVEAITEAQSAQRLDPRSPSIKSATAMAYFFGGKYQNSLAETDKALAIDEGFVPALKVKRWTYAAMNDIEAARSIYQKELSFSGGKPTDAGWAIIDLQLTPPAADKQEKLRLMDQILADPFVKRNHFAFAYEIAIAYEALCEATLALDWLEAAEAAGAHGFNFLEVDPRLANLRDDPRFQKLLHKLTP
jgi:serine/threonine protein kinase/tetratricopeptide (TPR) repeat protein